jgi:murein DD-endopeptidase MepM/ murein hydrolase activator NlpD
MAEQTIVIKFNIDDLNRVKSSLNGLNARATLSVDDSKVRSSISSLNSLMAGVAAGISSSITNSITGGISNAFRSAGNLVTSGLELAFNKQAQLVSLTASLQGNKKQAEDIYATVQKIADTSPLKTSEILGVTKQLISTGYEAEKSFTVVKALMDAAAVANPTNMGQGLKDLGDVYAKNAAGGRWMTEDLNQFQSRGINISKQLATDLSTTVAGVRKLASEGKLTSDVVEKSFLKMADVGGQLNNQMKALAGTSVGLKSTMEDAFDAILIQGGEALQPAIDKGLILLTALAEDLKKAGIFDEINKQAQFFAKSLEDNPKLIEKISLSIQELVRGSMTELGVVTGNIIKWLQDPKNMTNLIEGSKVFLENMKQVLTTLSEIMVSIATLIDVFKSPLTDINKEEKLPDFLRNPQNYTDPWSNLIRQSQRGALDMFGFKDVALPGQVVPGRVISEDDNAAKIFNFFKSKGFTNEQSAGWVGNLKHESGLDPTRYQEGGGPGRGLAQWEVGGRFEELKKFAATQGKSWDDLQVQLDFIWKELQTTEKEAYDLIKRATSVVSATKLISRDYERPNPDYASNDKRLAYAQEVLNKLSNNNTSITRAGVNTASAGIVTNNIELVSPSSLLRIDAGLLTSPMGMRNGRMHSGTDYDFGDKSPIATGAMNGVVTEVGYEEGGYGNYVVVKYPDGSEVLYAHLSEVKVKQGDKVGPYTIVGTQGSTGRSSASHLHIEKLVGGKAVEISGEIDKYLSVRPTYPDLLGKGNKVATSTGTLGGALSSLSGGTLNETKDLFDNILPELKAKYEKEDAELKLIRAKRDAALNIENAELKALVEKTNKNNDAREDLAREEARGIELLNLDTKAKPLNKKANDDKIAAIKAESKAKLLTLDIELENILKTFELTNKKRVEEEKLRTAQLAIQATSLGLQALNERETDTNKKAKYAYDLQLNNIKDKYKVQLDAVAKSITETDKLIAEYTRLKVSTTSLQAIKDELVNQQTYTLSAQGAELDLARSGRRSGAIDFIKTLQTEAKSTADSYNQQTMGTLDYNDYKRRQGTVDANKKASDSLAQLESLKDVLDPEQFKKAAEYIEQIRNADISNIKAQFQDLGRIVTTELVVGLGEAFKSVIQGTKSVGQAVVDMLSNIASKILDMAMNQLITNLLGGLFGGNSNSSGGSSIVSAGISALTGGIIPFANGGIVNQPTLALIGEGADSEAVLPIPKLNELMAINRSIGAIGSQGGGVVSNVNVTINNDGSANITGQQGSNLSSKISDAVRKVIADEKNRPGGMLYA